MKRHTRSYNTKTLYLIAQNIGEQVGFFRRVKDETKDIFDKQTCWQHIGIWLVVQTRPQNGFVRRCPCCKVNQRRGVGNSDERIKIFGVPHNMRIKWCTVRA